MMSSKGTELAFCKNKTKQITVILAAVLAAYI